VFPVRYEHRLHIKSKGIPVNRPRKPIGLSDVDNRLTDGAEVASLTSHPTFNPINIFGYYFR
jgi:hypothetical protein